jgi:acetyltransferase-like isoleucine patch superfamily enzyme
MTVAHKMLDMLPPFLRRIVFKMTLARFGAGSYIDYGSFIRYPWKVRIGQGVVLNQGVRIFPSFKIKETYIEIGDWSIVAPGVMFLGAGHSLEVGLPDISENIIIGKNCFIGAGAIVRYGVIIGDEAVIAAGSVVVKNVPPGQIYGGNPASFIRMRHYSL